MKKFLVATASLAALIAASAHATPTEKTPTACDAFANTMTKRVVDIFHDTKTDEDKKRDILADTFQEAVDTDWIGKFVLGHYWAAATDADKKEYLAAYRDYLTLVYISKFNEKAGMSVDTITIAGLTPHDKDTFEAKTLISRKGEQDVHVDYLLDQAGGKCQVHDIKIEGVSLLASQRSEFGALASNSGLRGVIDAMKKQLAAAD